MSKDTLTLKPLTEAELKHLKNTEVERISAQPPVYALRVKRFRPDAVLPWRATSGSIGYDLFMPADSPPLILQALVPVKVKLGLAWEMPAGVYGRIAPRSGSGSGGVHILAGVVDGDYREEVCVCLCLLGLPGQTFEIPASKAIAQLILEVAASWPVFEVEELSVTERAGGFGSTDK